MPVASGRSLSQFQMAFSDEASCVAFMFKRRWPDGYVCPRAVSAAWPHRKADRAALSRCGRKNAKGRRLISSGCDGLARRVHRRSAQGAMRSGGGEVALNVEGVVDRGVG